MALTEEQKRMVRADFVTWTQGVLPLEEPGAIETQVFYIEAIAPRHLDTADLHELFKEWRAEVAAEGA